MNDNEIVDLFLSRNEKAISCAAELYGAKLRSIAYGILNDRESAVYKYRDCVIDPASLDDIMLFYVHADAKEWS